jgi:hypothetical protein
MTQELSELEFSYKDKGAIALVKEIAEAWFRRYTGSGPEIRQMQLPKAILSGMPEEVVDS